MPEHSALLDELIPWIEEPFGKEKTAVVMGTAQKYYNDLVAENADEPKAMYSHTRARIYPGIAYFKAVTEAGMSREDAADLFLRFYRKRAEGPAAKLQNLLKFPGLYKLVPRIFKTVINKSFGADAGFKAVQRDTPKGELHIDMLVCPYYEICKKYGCLEIVPTFCETDDVAYGNMHPKVIWGRTKTLGKGGDCCDFKIKIKK